MRDTARDVAATVLVGLGIGCWCSAALLLITYGDATLMLAGAALFLSPCLAALGWLLYRHEPPPEPLTLQQMTERTQQLDAGLRAELARLADANRADAVRELERLGLHRDQPGRLAASARQTRDRP